MSEESKTVKVYHREYDDKSRGNNGLEGFLGEFEVIQEIVNDAWVYSFIGRNIINNKLYFIDSHEITGIGGGTLNNLIELSDIITASDLPDAPESYYDDWSDERIEEQLQNAIIIRAMNITSFLSKWESGEEVIIYDMIRKPQKYRLTLDYGNPQPIPMDLTDRDSTYRRINDTIESLENIKRSVLASKREQTQKLFDAFARSDSFVVDNRRIYTDILMPIILGYAVGFINSDENPIKEILYYQMGLIVEGIKHFCNYDRKKYIQILLQLDDWGFMYHDKD